jgi:hypothetical protein
MTAPWQSVADVAAAWLMPWRAVRMIRQRGEDQRLLIRTIADVARERDEFAVALGLPTIVEQNAERNRRRLHAVGGNDAP